MNPVDGKRLVIFGCGYVGGEVAHQAVNRGLRVTALTRNTEQAAKLRAVGIEVVVANLATQTWHAAIPGGADYVLNAVSSGGGGVEGYRQSYAEGARSIVHWAKTAGKCGTLIYTSSTSVYPQDGGVWVDERAPTDKSGELPQVLLEAERILQETSTSLPVEPGGPDVQTRGFERCFVLRLAGIYGPGRAHLIEQVRKGVVAGRGDHHLNLVHLDDIAAAIWSAIDAPNDIKGGIFNVVDDGAAPKTDVVNWIAKELGMEPPVFTGEPAAGRRAVTPDRIIVNTKLKETLGWRPRFPTFREGLKNRLALDSE